MKRLLPWAASWLVPGLLVGGLYALGGAQLLGVLIGGAVGGVVGVLGAITAEFVRSTTQRREQEAEVDQLARETLAERERRSSEHEGLQRMHEDIQRDEERRRGDQP